MKNIVSRVIEEIQKGDILTSLTLFILLVCIFYFYNVYFGKVVEGFQYGPWQTIKIGSSSKKTKSVALSKEFMVFDNKPQNKQQSNWKDRFSTRVVGKTLYVTRIDHNSWGQPLKLRGRVDNLARIRAAAKKRGKPKANCSAAEKKAKDAEAQRDSANKKLGIIYGDITRVPPGYDKLKNIPALEKQITELENKRDKIKKKRDEYINLYDKAQKRINNPIDGDPRGLLAQIAQLKGSGAAAKSQYEKNKAAAEARRLADLKAKEEEKKAAAEAAKIRLAEEALETESALEQARKAKAQAESERREYLILRKRLEARINQLNAQQGKSNEELYAALAKINELKRQEIEQRANMKERIIRERANAVATERSLMKKTYERRLMNRIRRFIRRFNLEEERKRQEKVKKQREKTQELLGLRRQYLRQYTMDIHNKEKLEKEENMLKQVQTSQDAIQTMNKRDTPEDGVEPSITGYSSSQPQILNGSVGNQQRVGVSRIGENRRKQFGVHQSNVYLTVPKDSKNKDDVQVGRKTIGGNIIPSLD